MATMNRRNLPGDYSELPPICPSHVAWSRTKMAHFPRSLSSLTDLARPRRLALLAVLATAVLPSTADARIGSYDGIWNVTFATTRGNCSSGYSVPFTVTGGRVSSAGGGRVSGTVQSRRRRRGPGLGRRVPRQWRRPARRAWPVQAPGTASFPATAAAASGMRPGPDAQTARRKSGRAVELSVLNNGLSAAPAP